MILIQQLRDKWLLMYQKIQIFEKDCLIRLGTCIAPVGIQKSDSHILKYEILFPNKKLDGQLMPGEIKLIAAPYEAIEVKLIPGKGLDVGAGNNEILTTQVFGGEIGIILDGRGRQPFNLSDQQEKRVKDLSMWSKNTQEFPNLESK